MNKENIIRSMEYYLALKMKEVLLRATTLINLEDSLLREINQSQKDKYCIICIIPFFEVFTVDKSIEIESRTVVSRADGEGDGKLLFNGYRV